MRKILQLSLLLVFLCLSLLFLAALPSAAQEPTPPAKGTDLTPGEPTVTLSSTTPLPPLERAVLAKIEPALLKQVIETKGDLVPFIVYLAPQADLTRAVATPGLQPQAGAGRLARRTAVVNLLQQTARSSQGGVLQILRQAASAGGLSGKGIGAVEINPFWVINAVAARGSLETILALAGQPEVAAIRLDKKIKINRPVGGRLDLEENLALIPHQATEWNISKIRAALVHTALGIDGAGVVVANMDTGVDWLHPALQTRYRGYLGADKLPLHVGNWMDTTGAGTTYPIDGDGHGSHTMGTMVGANGIGVAPGAKWIAVKAFDNTGTAQTSWLHEGFQWLLAPNGDPALAPDVINNSWSNDNSLSTEFSPDIQALLAAGIYPVFASGNDGPGSGTVGSPASLAIAFAVGATTSDDEAASFSSRGPNPWGQIKPDVSAPGKGVLSALPGGVYGKLDGTSMAAPHVAGLAALLLQASPALASDLATLSQVITTTALPLGQSIPNNDTGYGRIDAYSAVMSVAAVGTLSGTVTRAGSSTPVSEATISIAPHGGGPTIKSSSGSNGNYIQGLAANSYDVTASAFGYVPTTRYNLGITTGTATIQNFSLNPKPTGILMGVIREKGSNKPLVATIRLDGTPAQTTSNGTGNYSLTLPEGVYTATVTALGYRVAKVVNININGGNTVTQNIWLDPAPKILLVDSGKWYQDSQINYYRQALNDLLYTYDLWQITDPFATPGDIPPVATLKNYDIVIWSAPTDSPGYIGADKNVEEFLKDGGKLFLSGQDIAYYDGGAGFLGAAPYLRKYLKTTFVQDNASSRTLTGSEGQPFAGLSFQIQGGNGADNQGSPDVIALTDLDFAGPLLSYEDSSLGGAHIGLCVPYRTIFLPFGFEAISTRADRSAVMQHALDWLTQPLPANRLELTPLSETKVGNFGTVMSHTIRVRNTGSKNDNYTLSVSQGLPYNWPATVVSPTLSLTSCQSQTVRLDVQVPAAKKWHISDTVTLTVQSATAPAITQMVSRTTKTPAPVLLVDDDRWYSFAAQYKASLEANQISYDYWQVPKSWSGEVPSPPLATLKMYPMTIWYTAYDWLQPLTPTEEERLAAYLESGGRLFFSGQDYIYNLPEHKPSSFTQNYLGVQAHREDFSSTIVIGKLTNPVGDNLGPYPLTFPPGYNNWTDALIPTTSAEVATVGQVGQVNGVTNVGVGAGGRAWHTLFLSYGPELLAEAERERLMQRSVGWLSWLGRSTVTPSISTALDGEIIVYTATLTNDGWDTVNTAYFTATFPAELTPQSFSAGLTPLGADLVWQGPLNRNQSRIFTYTARLADTLPLGTAIKQVSWLGYPEHQILFDRIATVKANFPDLSGSTLTVSPSEGVKANDILNYTITLKNNGQVEAPIITVTNTLPDQLEPVAIDPPGQGNLISQGRRLTWTLSLPPDGLATLTYRGRISYETSIAIENGVYVDNGFESPLLLTARTTFKTVLLHLPLIFKGQ